MTNSHTSMTPQPKEADEMRAEVERLAREAMEARFALRLATEEQRNGYEVGWYEGYLEALTRTPPSASIEVTEEMIEAGLKVLDFSFDQPARDAAFESEMLEHIYLAMARARQKDQGHD
jgi:hypothetical protein